MPLNLLNANATAASSDAKRALVLLELLLETHVVYYDADGNCIPRDQWSGLARAR